MTAMRTDEIEQALFGMMALAEEQHAAVREALAGLGAERAALAQERAQLAQQAQAMRAEVAGLRQAANDVAPVLALSTQVAVERAVQRSLAGAGATAAEAVQAAAQPMLERLSGVAASAAAVEASLRRVVDWASWRLLGRGAALVAGLAGLLWLAHLSAWWWTERELRLTQAQRALLQSEIAGLEANRDALVQAGALAKMSRCGTGSKPCIRINEAAGAFGSPPDYRVIQGY